MSVQEVCACVGQPSALPTTNRRGAAPWHSRHIQQSRDLFHRTNPSVREGCCEYGLQNVLESLRKARQSCFDSPHRACFQQFWEGHGHEETTHLSPGTTDNNIAQAHSVRFTHDRVQEPLVEKVQLRHHQRKRMGIHNCEIVFSSAGCAEERGNWQVEPQRLLGPVAYAKESCRTRLMVKMNSFLTAPRPCESETSCASVFLCARV